MSVQPLPFHISHLSASVGGQPLLGCDPAHVSANLPAITATFQNMMQDPTFINILRHYQIDPTSHETNWTFTETVNGIDIDVSTPCQPFPIKILATRIDSVQGDCQQLLTTVDQIFRNNLPPAQPGVVMPLHQHHDVSYHPSSPSTQPSHPSYMPDRIDVDAAPQPVFDENTYSDIPRSFEVDNDVPYVSHHHGSPSAQPSHPSYMPDRLEVDTADPQPVLDGNTYSNIPLHFEVDNDVPHVSHHHGSPSAQPSHPSPGRVELDHELPPLVELAPASKVSNEAPTVAGVRVKAHLLDAVLSTLPPIFFLNDTGLADKIKAAIKSLDDDLAQLEGSDTSDIKEMIGRRIIPTFQNKIDAAAFYTAVPDAASELHLAEAHLNCINYALKSLNPKKNAEEIETLMKERELAEAEQDAKSAQVELLKEAHNFFDHFNRGQDYLSQQQAHLGRLANDSSVDSPTLRELLIRQRDYIQSAQRSLLSEAESVEDKRTIKNQIWDLGKQATLIDDQIGYLDGCPREKLFEELTTQQIEIEIQLAELRDLCATFRGGRHWYDLISLLEARLKAVSLEIKNHKDYSLESHEALRSKVINKQDQKLITTQILWLGEAIGRLQRDLDRLIRHKSNWHSYHNYQKAITTFQDKIADVKERVEELKEQDHIELTRCYQRVTRMEQDALELASEVHRLNNL